MILIGWSWDICAKDINNIRINIVFQTITYLLGNEFIKEWLNNKSNLADYLMLAYDKLIENYGEKRAEKIMKIFCKISIEETSKKDKLELEKWKEIIKETKVELDKLENKAKYLEELTKKKKDITKKIEEIDKIINNQELLKKEYDDRNSKLPNKEKIFSVRQLLNKLEVERQNHVDEIRKYNDLIEPKGYVERKEKIKRKHDFLQTLELERKEEQTESIVELCRVFLECFKIIIMKTAIKQDIIKCIYELRYYRFIPFDKETSIKQIETLKKEFDESMVTLYEKARAMHVIEDVTKDEKANYEIVSKIFDSKMIDLNNMVIEAKVENGRLFIQYYDTNILENVIEYQSDKTIKLNKKTKLFV